jgi:hypothetical protein
MTRKSFVRFEMTGMHHAWLRALRPQDEHFAQFEYFGVVWKFGIVSNRKLGRMCGNWSENQRRNHLAHTNDY